MGKYRRSSGRAGKEKKLFPFPEFESRLSGSQPNKYINLLAMHFIQENFSIYSASCPNA